MVLPPGPPPSHSTLHHVQTDCIEVSHEAGHSVAEDSPRRRPSRRDIASDGVVIANATANASNVALHNVVGLPTLPRRLRRLRARSREGVAMSHLPTNATLHRFSLPLGVPTRPQQPPLFTGNNNAQEDGAFVEGSAGVDSSVSYGSPERV